MAGHEVARIDAGLLLLAGFGRDDNAPVVQRAATRIVNLRVFANASGRFQYSVAECAGDVLLVPQFTLYGDLSRGRRPDFTAALEPRQANVLFDALVQAFRDCGIRRARAGVFGAVSGGGILRINGEQASCRDSPYPSFVAD